MSQSQELPPHIKELFDKLSSLPKPEECGKCGSKLMHVETTFFLQVSNSGPFPCLFVRSATLRETRENSFSLMSVSGIIRHGRRDS